MQAFRAYVTLAVGLLLAPFHVPLHPEGDLFRFIHNGIQGTAMPAWSPQLSDDEIWHLINYLKTLPQVS